MPNNEPASVEDRLGILNALIQHMEEGGCCDELTDERLFPNHILRMVGSTQLVVDENFGGNTKEFHLMMYMQVAEAVMRGEDPLIAVERWLNDLLKQSGTLYN